MGRGGGRAATCCVQLCSKVSPTSAEKLSRETMSTLQRGWAFRTAPSPPATASASLSVSALQMLMSFLPNAALSAEAVNQPWCPSLTLATTLPCVSPEGRRAQNTSKTAGALGERPVVFLLVAKGFRPSGVGQAHPPH